MKSPQNLNRENPGSPSRPPSISRRENAKRSSPKTSGDRTAAREPTENPQSQWTQLECGHFVRETGEWISHVFSGRAPEKRQGKPLPRGGKARKWSWQAAVGPWTVRQLTPSAAETEEAQFHLPIQNDTVHESITRDGSGERYTHTEMSHAHPGSELFGERRLLNEHKPLKTIRTLQQ